MSIGCRGLSSLALRSVTAILATIAVDSCSSVYAQSIAGVGNTTSTPVPGVPHDYITGLSEIVNPANGAVSVRIKAPTPHERGSNWPTYAFTYDSDGQYTLVTSWSQPEGGDLFVAFEGLSLQQTTQPGVTGQLDGYSA